MEYEVIKINKGCWVVNYKDNGQAIGQMITDETYLISFCVALNTAGHTAANDWTKLF